MPFQHFPDRTPANARRFHRDIGHIQRLQPSAYASKIRPERPKHFPGRLALRPTASVHVLGSQILLLLKTNAFLPAKSANLSATRLESTLGQSKGGRAHVNPGLWRGIATLIVVEITEGLQPQRPHCFRSRSMTLRAST